MSHLNRRRFIAIAAASALTPGMGQAKTVRWTGRALGGAVSMQLAGVDDTTAARVFAEVENELERLERIFSLYRSDSELSRLNRDGRLDAPSAEFLQVLSQCAMIHDASGGAFDPTIQPVWQALADDADPSEQKRAWQTVGWSKLRFDSRMIVLPSNGALTLNGIAQGAITDRIADMLKARGLTNVLVDIGEIAAMGHRPDGSSWAVGIANPNGEVIHRVRATDRAIATSAPGAMQIHGTVGHILSPFGKDPSGEVVSVSAPRAAVADGLSTALCLLPEEQASRVVEQFPGARIEFLKSNA